MNEIIGTITVVMTLILYGFYIRDTLTEKITPHPFSWAIWLVITSTIFVAQVSDNAGPGAWMNGVVTITNFIILVLSLKNGMGIIKKFDIFIFSLSIFSIPLWMITSDPLWSVILLVFANTLAYIPTYRKSYKNPYNEALYLYGINFFRHGLSIVALANYTTVTMLSPFMLVLNNGALALFLLWRRHQILKH